MYAAVIKVFVKLFNDGKLYRGLRMTNWDPEAQTVLSNEEVVHHDENGNLYHIRYRLEGTDDTYITVATSRPETMMGDTALAVNPDDARYRHHHGRNVIVPLIGRVVPVIADEYVDAEFGTGALKITPAHDPNDFVIGEKYGLEVIDIMTPDGKMNELAGIAVGMDRFDARIEVIKQLKASGDLTDIKPYRAKIGRSERTDAVVEPRLTLQWFMKMDDTAATALAAVKNGDVKFHPANMVNMYESWLRPENVRDWCVSRQLWWGQRIPAWYHGDEVYVAETADDALKQARLKHPGLRADDLKQDEDVLDTWFSSWLWPITVFDGFGDDKTELAYYYPTNDLVTGWDIMFFWVARMIMAGYEFSEDLLGKEFVEKHGRQPFRDVYFTGMVRDEKRRKMSKSLGNSPNALELLKKYGADGVRYGMLSSAAAGNDIVFDAPIADGKVLDESQLCEQGRKFCNKIFNANRLLQQFEVVDLEPDPAAALATQWIRAKLNQSIAEVDRMIEEYRLSEAMITIYRLIWSDFCGWYLEAIKPADGNIPMTTHNAAIATFERMMTLLHPFMPFITEEVWHSLRDRGQGEDCVVSNWPRPGDYDLAVIEEFALLQGAVSHVRDVRNQRKISHAEPLSIAILRSERSEALFGGDAGAREFVQKAATVGDIRFVDTAPEGTLPFLIGNDTAYLILNEEVDVAAERAKTEEELTRLMAFLTSIEKKLGNERFVANAPEEVVQLERRKREDALMKIAGLEAMLST